MSPMSLGMGLGITRRPLGTGGGSIPVDVANRAHLSPAAKAQADALVAAFSGAWAGTDSVMSWDTDQVATSANDFNSKAAALVTGLGQKHRIRLSSSGDWATASIGQLSVRAKDFLTGGGCLRVEPETGNGPTVTVVCRVDGARGVHWNNVTAAAGMIFDRSATRDLWSVVRASNCRVGHYYQGLAVIANYPIGINCSHSDDIALVNNTIRRVSTAIRFVGNRLNRAFFNDLQERSNDGISRYASTSTINGSSLDTRYPDRKVYHWMRCNTDRNVCDDPSLTAVHFDFIQTGHAADVADSVYLDEFNTSYTDLINTGSNVSQGNYQDDSPRALIGVAHSNLIAINGFHALVGFGGSSGSSEHWMERNTLVRTAGSTADNEPRLHTDFFAGGSVLTHTRDNIAAQYLNSGRSGKLNGTYDSAGDVIADPRIGTASPNRYQDCFAGSFAPDGNGRTSYSFIDDGLQSQAAFRAALFAQFEPSGDPNKGVPNPALWPAA